MTSDPSASSKTRRRSKARVPSSIGTPSETNRRWRSSTRQWPNSSVVSAAASVIDLRNAAAGFGGKERARRRHSSSSWALRFVYALEFGAAFER